MRSRVPFWLIPFFFLACSSHKNTFNDYVSGARAIDIGINGALADSLFGGVIPGQSLSHTAVLYTDADCSACISSAIELYKSFKKAETSYSLVILLGGPDRETFDYYWQREFPDGCSETHAFIILSPKIDDIPKGVYVVERNIAQHYSIWSGP